MKFIYQEKYKYLFNICLNVTDSCNLACRYCFVEQHPHFMSLETAKKATDWVYNNLQEAKKIEAISPNHTARITFFGGEPMLMYEQIIVPLVQYIEEKYPNQITLSMTTNGTLLNKERIDFLYSHHVGLLLSIDGKKETQDYNRPCRNGESSFDLIEKNISYLLKLYPNLFFRATIFSDTVKYTYENYLYAESLGFQNIFFIPDNRHFWSQEQIDILHDQINMIFNYRLNQILNHKHIPDFDTIRQNHKLAYFAIKNDNPYLKEQLSVERCGLGTAMGSISYDGTIYGCQEQTSGYEHNNIFILGNIFTGGIDVERHKKLLLAYTENTKLQNIEYPNKCKDCLMKNVCNKMQGCPSTSFDLQKNFNSQANIQCFYNELLFLNSLAQLLILTPLAEQDQFINDYICSLFEKTIK